jgi:hypothetical protein
MCVAPKRIVESKQFIRGTEEESREVSSEEQTLGSDGRPLFEPKGIYFPTDSHETDERAKRVLADLQREQKSRVQNPSLLLNDLRKLGMYGELSDDNYHINMPFEDLHRLVTTMRIRPAEKKKWLNSKLNWMLNIVLT